MAPAAPMLTQGRGLGANLGATRTNDFRCQADGFGQPIDDQPSSRTDPDDGDRLTGIYGSEGWGSSPSERARSTALRPLGSGLLANGFANSSVSSRRYRPRDDIGCLGDLLADHVSVDPQRDRRIGMAQPGRDHMDRHPAISRVVAWRSPAVGQARPPGAQCLQVGGHGSSPPK